MKQGWEIKRLPEIAEYFIGLTYSPNEVSDKGIIVLRSSNIQNDELDLSDLVRVTRPVKEMLKVREGDILMCSRNGSKRLVGKTTMIGSLPEDMTFGTFMTAIRGKNNSYLNWFFKSDAFREQLGVGENTMINQVTKYMLDTIRLPVPPLPEQQRIVAVLDEAFAGIAKATDNAKKNLQNARELFESHLQSIFTTKGDGWVEKTLGDVCTTTQGVQIAKNNQSSDSKKGYRRYLYISDFDHDKNIKYVADTHPKKVVAIDDLVVVNTGATAGKIYKGIDGILSNNLFKVSYDNKIINKEFLYYFVTSSLFKEHQKTIVKGTANPHMGHENFKSTQFSYPPLPEQQRIVAQLDVLSAETKRLEAIYQQKMNNLAALKQSILQKAFAGELNMDKLAA